MQEAVGTDCIDLDRAARPASPIHDGSFPYLLPTTAFFGLHRHRSQRDRAPVDVSLRSCAPGASAWGPQSRQMS